MSDPKDDLVRYLYAARDAMIWKLDGLSEYDVRRPLVPTGTNLLGLIKHVAIVTAGYFGDTFDRPFPEVAPWLSDDAEENADMWANTGETRDDILGLWERAWAHAEATITELPLDAIGHVPWWNPATNEVTLHKILCHMTAEAQRHAGHADLVRELIDGSVGLRADVSNLPSTDGSFWAAHYSRVDAAARSFL
ncbi:MAG: DinB family protein [Hamadaea sp.]|uniref:DinB family protein n=1 Tax=Hamadaea sp. TaxID=2024425 RepID=UPI00182794F0|nr:DinB family protein [Hamadaea sp.]NUR71921.1 DinB family protein [Hamadaea sp.]NUT18224.1 DinB family protein [Hamadaea sp.]